MKRFILSWTLCAILATQSSAASLNDLNLWEKINPQNYAEKINRKIDPLRVSGNYRTSFGHFANDSFVTWKNADFNLNERNYNLVFGENKLNTFDPAIYNRISINLDNAENSSYIFHANLTFDPWTYVGKTDKIQLTSEGGDIVEVELKYWSNTSKTINQQVQSLKDGDAYNIPQISIKDNKTYKTAVNSVFATNNGRDTNKITIPELSLRRSFQPLRELWIGWRTYETEIHFFPMAYEDRAQTSNDPLMLSNKRIYWEPSPWTQEWIPGHFNSGNQAQDYTRGRLSSEIPIISRDSDGRYLTALRGLYVTTGKDESENDFFEATIASPKNLWQSYSEVNTLPGSIQKRFSFTENSNFGLVYNFLLGFNNRKEDYRAQVASLDGVLQVTQNIKFSVQGALAQTQVDKTLQDIEKKNTGGAWHLQLDFHPSNNLYPLRRKDNIGLSLYYTYMGRHFNPVLSTYKQTRNDPFWGQHIHFEDDKDSAYNHLYKLGFNWGDTDRHRIGDGIDVNRKVFRASLKRNFFDNNTEFLGDVRDVRNADNKDWIESVYRAEITQNLGDTFLLKGMYWNMHLPGTKAGKDPFVRDPYTDEFVNNTLVQGGKDPSVRSYSGGIEFKLFDRLTLQGIYERTNNYGEFPRAILLGSFFDRSLDGAFFVRRHISFLYNQEHFPLPPYPYSNIYRIKSDLEITRALSWQLNWSRNEFAYVYPLDSNFSHIQTVLTYAVKTLLVRGQYTLALDPNANPASNFDLDGDRHNFSLDLSWRTSELTELQVQYGASRYVVPASGSSLSPTYETFNTVDTQHFFKVVFQGKF